MLDETLAMISILTLFAVYMIGVFTIGRRYAHFDGEIPIGVFIWFIVYPFDVLMHGVKE